MTSATSKELFPELAFDAWTETRKTLHLFLQIVGKLRLYMHPKKNHWWHVPLYVSPRGLTTRSIPYQGRLFEMEFDFFDHALAIRVSDGTSQRIGLQGKTVAQFFRAVEEGLGKLDIRAVWQKPYPYDLPFSKTPFAEDDQHGEYDSVYAQRYWRVLSQIDPIFQRFRGQFGGKGTLPHLFWHHMDLALTLFSGKRVPVREGAGLVEREGYSHEVISFGFWAGDDKVPAPAFYAYAAPVPDGLFDSALKPAEASWNAEAGMAVMMYDAIRVAADPGAKIADFLASTYAASAKAAGWDVESLGTQGA
jgi:hypothetical protein